MCPNSNPETRVQKKPERMAKPAPGSQAHKQSRGHRWLRHSTRPTRHQPFPPVHCPWQYTGFSQEESWASRALQAAG